MHIASIRGLTKSFNGTVVVDEFGLEVESGDVWGLIGSNGSGKSTVVKMLSGFYRPDTDGGVVLEPGCQMVFVHQDLGLVNDLSVMENLAVSTGFITHPLWGIDWRRQRASAEETLAGLELDFGPDRLVSTLSPSQKSLVAIARALHRSGQSGLGTDRRLLVLDEPTASLTESDARLVGNEITKIAARGEAVLIVTHRLAEIQAYTNKVCILRDGRVVAQQPTEQMSEQEMMDAMLGPAASGRERLTTRARDLGSDEVVLATTGLRGRVIKPIDLTVHRGEIVGVTGLSGCGKSELGRLLSGAQSPEGGVLTVSGRQVGGGQVATAMSAGVGYIPENRRENSVVPGLTAAENLVLPALVRAGLAALTSRAADLRVTREWMDALQVTPRAPSAPVDTFSGGNQQKLVFAKWLKLNPAVLILDEPTQAVDVGASEDIYALLRARADEGMSVLLVSSEWPDLCKLCDRVLVLDRGAVVTELAGDELTENNIARACHATVDSREAGERP